MHNRKLRICISLLIFLTFVGCLQQNPTVTQCWFYTYQTDFNTSNENGLTPASFICIRKDGTYTKDFGTFDYGHWTRKDGLINLLSQRNQSESLKIISLSANEMTIDINSEKINLDAQMLPSDKSSEDPFSIENNQWRIPASQKENEQALRKRLSNHCRFWEVYFSWALKTNQETVDVRSTPTLIKIYGNGFTLKPVTDQPGRWRSYFFDDEDCQKAYDIMKNIVFKRDIALAHTDNKYKMFIGAFQQLETALK
jgi:hypothetical protein